jgi:dUTP pyrophosphatase
VDGANAVKERNKLLKQKIIELLQPLSGICIIAGMTLTIFSRQQTLPLILMISGLLMMLACFYFGKPIIQFEKVTFSEYLKTSGNNDNYNISKEYNDIKLPQRATSGSAGYDFFSPRSFMLQAGESIKLPTGIRVKIENINSFLMIVPRSSLGFKYRMQLDNTCGVVDKDYFYSDNEGHIFAKLTNDGKEGKAIKINKGEAFAQGIFLNYRLTNDDNVTTIRNGGFGSTDKKGK